jgi:hypothetical protein
MKEPEHVELLNLLKQAYNAFKQEDIKKLRSLSDHIIEDASIIQDDYSISLAIVIYTLSKILEKERYSSYPGWNNFYNNCTNKLKKLFLYLEDSNFNKYSYTLKELLSQIKGLDKKAPEYIEELVNSSRIKKSSNLYGYGLSLGRAANLLGISQWELMNYVGSSSISNENIKTISAKDRFNIAKKVFNIK